VSLARVFALAFVLLALPATALAQGGPPAPTIIVGQPTEATVYYVGDVIHVDYTCSVTSCDGAQCQWANGAPVDGTCVQLGPGALLDTTTAGTYAFMVTAQGTGRRSTTASVHFTVAPPPDDSSAPVDTGPLPDFFDDTESGDDSTTTDDAPEDQSVLGARLTACKLTLHVPRGQRQLAKRGLAVTLSSDRACTVKLAATLMGSVRAKPVRVVLRPHRTRTVRLRLAKGLGRATVIRGRLIATDNAHHRVSRRFRVTV